MMAAERPRPRRWAGPVLAFSGLILGWYGLRILGASYAITRWPVVPARIIHSTVESTSKNRFRPRVRYEFYLAGRRYVGGGISRPESADQVGGPSISWNRAEEIVARYPVGQELLAGYDPIEPGRAVLEPRLNGWTLVPVAMGAFLAAVGIMIWRHSRRATSLNG